MHSNWVPLAVIVIVAVVILILVWQAGRPPAPSVRPLTSEQHEHLQQFCLDAVLQAALIREYANALNFRARGTNSCTGQIGARIDAASERIAQTLAYFMGSESTEEVTEAFNGLNKCLESAIVLLKNKQSITEEKATCKEQARALVATLNKYLHTIKTEALTRHFDDYIEATLEQVQDIFAGNCNSSLVNYETKVVATAHQYASGLSQAIIRHINSK